MVAILAEASHFGRLRGFADSAAVAEGGMSVSETFDPYRKWLGIAPKDQPPNHYRLLGIDLFESDGDVIDAAANKQMSYIQQKATGQHAALSQKLLNEMSAARLCLLDPHRKAVYDGEIRAKNAAAAATPAPVVAPVQAAVPMPVTPPVHAVSPVPVVSPVRAVTPVRAVAPVPVVSSVHAAPPAPVAAPVQVAYPVPPPIGTLPSPMSYVPPAPAETGPKIPWLPIGIGGAVVFVLLVGVPLLFSGGKGKRTDREAPEVLAERERTSASNESSVPTVENAVPEVNPVAAPTSSPSTTEPAPFIAPTATPVSEATPAPIAPAADEIIEDITKVRMWSGNEIFVLDGRATAIFYSFDNAVWKPLDQQVGSIYSRRGKISESRISEQSTTHVFVKYETEGGNRSPVYRVKKYVPFTAANSPIPSTEKDGENVAAKVPEHIQETWEFKGHYYKVFWVKLSYSDAKARCEAMGGQLACFGSAEERAFVAKLKEKGRVAWVGGRKVNNKWMWLDGTALETSGSGVKGVPRKEYNAVALGNGGNELIAWAAYGRVEHYPVKDVEGFVCEWDSKPKEP